MRAMYRRHLLLNGRYNGAAHGARTWLQRRFAPPSSDVIFVRRAHASRCSFVAIGIRVDSPAGGPLMRPRRAFKRPPGEVAIAVRQMAVITPHGAPTPLLSLLALPAAGPLFCLSFRPAASFL